MAMGPGRRGRGRGEGVKREKGEGGKGRGERDKDSRERRTRRKLRRKGPKVAAGLEKQSDAAAASRLSPPAGLHDRPNRSSSGRWLFEKEAWERCMKKKHGKDA